jgi:PAS domain S-box-containing protein
MKRKNDKTNSSQHAHFQNEGSNHFETFFKHITMGIVITDSSGKIAAINSFALAEFGYNEQEVLGKKIEMLIPARCHELHVKHRQEFFETHIPGPWVLVWKCLD